MTSPQYFAVLSGNHPCLSRMEFESLVKPSGSPVFLSQVAIFRFRGGGEELARAQVTSSSIKSVGRVLAWTGADREGLVRLLREGDWGCSLPPGPVNVTFHRVQSFSRHLRKDWVVDSVREYYRRVCGRRVRSGKPRVGYVNVIVVMVDGTVLIGHLLSWKGKGDLLRDNPHDLPYYAPGALNRWLTNLLINIATGADASRIVWDPFCGTGTLGIPHLDRGGVFVCSDVLIRHCRGALRNLTLVPKGGLPLLLRADASFPGLREEGVDAIVADLPYGRSVKGTGGDEVGLAIRFIETIPPLLKKGGRTVFMIPIDWWEALKARMDGFSSYRACPMYVHEGLTRMVVAADRL